MIWGIGTGRCGTKSAAKLFGGVHEPEPGLAENAALYARKKGRGGYAGKYSGSGWRWTCPAFSI